VAQNIFCLLDSGIIFIIVCKSFGKQIVFELGNNKYFPNVRFSTLNSAYKIYVTFVLQAFYVQH